MHSFSFWVDTSDITKAEGICLLQGDAISIEVQTKDNIIGLIKTRPKIHSFKLTDLISMEIEKDWFGGLFFRKVVLRFSSVSLADLLPGNDVNRVEMRFKRKEMNSVVRLVEEFTYAKDLKRLDAMY